MPSSGMDLACTTWHLMEGSTEWTHPGLCVQLKGNLGPSHIKNLNLSELNFEPNVLSHMQEIQTLPGDLFFTRSCALSAKENKIKEKKAVWCNCSWPQILLFSFLENNGRQPLCGSDVEGLSEVNVSLKSFFGGKVWTSFPTKTQKRM